MYIYEKRPACWRGLFSHQLLHINSGLSWVLCHCTGFAGLVWGTEWRRPIGCLELQVICRKRATNYRALWRKMTYQDKASYGSSPPCESNVLAKLCQIENRQYTNHPIWLESRQYTNHPIWLENIQYTHHPIWFVYCLFSKSPNVGDLCIVYLVICVLSISIISYAIFAYQLGRPAAATKSLFFPFSARRARPTCGSSCVMRLYCNIINHTQRPHSQFCFDSCSGGAARRVAARV